MILNQAKKELLESEQKIQKESDMTLKQIRRELIRIIDKYPQGFKTQDERNETIENFYIFAQGKKMMIYDAIKSSTNLSNSFVAEKIVMHIKKNFKDAKVQDGCITYKVKVTAQNPN